MSGAGLPRHLLKWVLGLDLSFQIKNARRDFSNGFLVAEICFRYFSSDVHLQMHSFENSSGATKKRENWKLLDKFFKKKNFTVTAAEMESFIQPDLEVIVAVLDRLHSWLTGRGGTDPAPRGGAPAGPAGMQQQAQQAHVAAGGYGYGQQHGGAGGGVASAFVFGGGGAGNGGGGGHQFDPPLPQQDYYHEPPPPPPPPPQQQYHEPPPPPPAMYGGVPSYDDMPGVGAPSLVQWDTPATHASPGGAYGGGGYGDYGGGYGGGYGGEAGAGPGGYGGYAAAGARREAEAADYAGRAPRPMPDFRPHTLQEYRQMKEGIAADSKGGGRKDKYWELGKLGPDVDVDKLGEQLRRREQLKEMDRQNRAANREREHERRRVAAGRPPEPAPPPPKVPSARERALQFAKNVPKPAAKPSRRNEENEAPGGSDDGEGVVLSELEKLELQHRRDQERMAAIRAELKI